MIDVFLDKKVDGLIICPSKDDKNYIEKLQNAKIPYVLVDRYFADIDSNVVDNKEGSFKIVDDQIKRGNRRIAYVNFNVGLINMEGRLVGYKQALKANGIPFDEKLVKNVTFKGIEKKTVKAVKGFLQMKEPVESIYFANNHLAFLGVKFIKQYNNNGKRQISICSFDSFNFMNLLDTPMVYGTHSIDKLGENAVDLIMKQIDSDTLINEKRILPIDIIEIK